jgi:hypothetical protein
VACRGNKSTPPSFAVMDMDGGKVLYTAEIGGGNDSLVYAPGLKRLFMANGVGAVLNVFEQVDANTYKPVEAVGTHAELVAAEGRYARLFELQARGYRDDAGAQVRAAPPR